MHVDTYDREKVEVGQPANSWVVTCDLCNPGVTQEEFSSQRRYQKTPAAVVILDSRTMYAKLPTVAI